VCVCEWLASPVQKHKYCCTSTKVQKKKLTPLRFLAQPAPPRLSFLALLGVYLLYYCTYFTTVTARSSDPSHGLFAAQFTCFTSRPLSLLALLVVFTCFTTVTAQFTCYTLSLLALLVVFTCFTTVTAGSSDADPSGPLPFSSQDWKDGQVPHIYITHTHITSKASKLRCK